MRVIEHGILYDEIVFKCTTCKCEYSAYRKECKTVPLNDEFGRKGDKVLSSCPECGNTNYRYYMEGGTI